MAPVLSCIVVASVAWLETSALETLHAYGGQFTLSTQFIKPNFQFNSTLNRYIDLKSCVTCLFVSYDLFLINSLFKFSIDLKILRRAFFQAGLTRRRTFSAVTHSYPTIVCVGGMLYLGRKKKQRHQEKEKYYRFSSILYFQSFAIS